MGYSEENHGAVIDDGEMDAGQAETMMPMTQSTPHQPSLHLSFDSQFTETICTDLVNDLLSPNPRVFFSLHLQLLSPLTHTSLLKIFPPLASA